MSQMQAGCVWLWLLGGQMQQLVPAPLKQVQRYCIAQYWLCCSSACVGCCTAALCALAWTASLSFHDVHARQSYLSHVPGMAMARAHDQDLSCGGTAPASWQLALVARHHISAASRSIVRGSRRCWCLLLEAAGGCAPACGHVVRATLLCAALMGLRRLGPSAGSRL